MYTRNNVLKLVALVLIHYHRTLEEICLIVHKVCWEYADMILFNKQHESTRYYDNFQVSITTTHLYAIEVSLLVIKYNFSPLRRTLLFGDEHKGSTKESVHDCYRQFCT